MLIPGIVGFVLGVIAASLVILNNKNKAIALLEKQVAALKK